MWNPLTSRRFRANLNNRIRKTLGKREYICRNRTEKFPNHSEKASAVRSDLLRGNREVLMEHGFGVAGMNRGCISLDKT
jgi:hypothetical protein